MDLSAEQPEGSADHVMVSTLAEHPARGTMAEQNVTPERILSQRVVSERVVSRRRLVSQTQIVSDFMESFGEAGIDDSPYTTRFTIFRRAGLPNSDQDASAFISPSAINVAPLQEMPDSSSDPDGSAPHALADVSRERIARNSIRRGQLALGTRVARLATSHIPPPSTLAEPARTSHTSPQVTANRVPDPPLIQLQRHLDHAQFTIVPSGQLVNWTLFHRSNNNNDNDNDKNDNRDEQGICGTTSSQARHQLGKEGSMIQLPCFITCSSAIRPYFRSHSR